MDWMVMISAAVGAGTPVIGVAFWLGVQSARQAGQEKKCRSECSRNSREHSSLFRRVEEHGEAIAGIRSDVTGIGHRVTVLEKR